MKKKNYYWSFMIAAIMAVMSVGFASCGDDKDESGSGSNSGLVGTWVAYHQSGAVSWYNGLKLEKNGDAYYTEWDSRESPQWPSNPGKWSASDGILRIIEPDGDIFMDGYYTLSEDGKTLYLSDGEDYLILTKQ